MSDNDNYMTVDGQPVPDSVIDTFDDPDAWPDSSLSTPDSVRTLGSVVGTLYEGFVDGQRSYVSERGHPTRADRYDYCEHVSDGELTPSVCNTYSYDDTVDVVHHDHYAEHVTQAIVVTGHRERIILCSRSGVVWWRYHGDVTSARDASDTARQLATALSDADTGVSLPDDYGSVIGGWHSSMERSEQSEAMNALAKGDIPKAELDDVDPFPYVVRYGDTRNVCSVNASIYAHEDTEHWFRDLFDGKRARPGHGGFA